MIAESPFAPTQISERHTWTYDEVCAQFEDDARLEIHDGTLFPMPSPTLDHQDLIGLLYRIWMNWAEKNGGRAFLSPIDLYVSPTKYYIPDLVFYTRQSLENPEVLADRKRLRVAPDLIVEVVSPSTRSNDRTVKVRAYAEFGVANYWILDPQAKTLEALELRDGVYFIAAALGDGETFSPANFPGLQVDLAALWALVA